MTKGLVSVIIPTFNNKLGMDNPIDDCLISVALSTYKNIEIISVDEGLKRSVQRNIGIKAAEGEYILYLDDDQYISRGLIEECVGLMKVYDAIFIPEIIVAQSWFGKLRNWEREFYPGTPVDCVRFFKHEGCPLFDENLDGPEDADFDHRLGGRRIISKNPLYHKDNVNVLQYLKKKAYYTKSMERYKEKWPDDKVLDWRYRCFWIFVENGRWIKLLRRPHYAILMFGLIFLRGVIYLCQSKG